MISKVKNIYHSLFFHPRFFFIWGAIVLIIFLGFWFPFLFVLGKYLFLIFVLISFFDFVYLLKQGKIFVKRKLPQRLSNGDNNSVLIEVSHTYNLPIYVNLIDELPKQFQKRDFELKFKMPPDSYTTKKYYLRPVKRGEYEFGGINVFVSSPFQLVRLRKKIEQYETVKVYPSFIQMKKYDLIALSNKSYLGVKKIRRLGHTMEFEHIKEYNKGDDYRTINWKATAKHNKLMVNQYQDEKSQNFYSIIDMGRMMKMPFHQMTLLDYAINSSLTIANIALKKKDKPGLITFEKKIHTFLKPDGSKEQLHLFFESLYAQKTRFLETDYERLYQFVRHNIPTRSLLMLYTNFEHINSLKRQLPFLKKIAKKHLFVVIIFKNTELSSLVRKKTASTHELYHKIIAQDFAWQKKMMIKELQLHNIQSILTAPTDLTTAVINKYLHLKARGLI